ncbi:MAG: hypothetical protein ACOX0E_01465 [Syntrophomonadaceae bacterium]|jgi:hypothetical protein
MDSATNETYSKNNYTDWQKISKFIWLSNSISTQLTEINYQLRELEKLLPEFKSTLFNLIPEESKKIEKTLANNFDIPEEFVTTWMRIQNLIKDTQ